MGSWFEQQAGAGPLALALPVAVLAGLVSFFSPCVIPLLPGYLSYATGISGADLAAGEAGHRRGRMLAGSLLFVLGITVVFVLVGTAIGGAGVWLRRYEDPITFVMGVLLIVLGLVFAGLVPWLQREWRIHTIPAVGLGAAPRPTAGTLWMRHSRCSHGTTPAKTRPSTMSSTPMTTVIVSS